MAISGGTAALVLAGARQMGVSTKQVAKYSNFTANPAFAVAVNGTNPMQGDATWSNIPGTQVRVDWGDGTVEYTANDGAATHVYATTGAKTVNVSGLGIGKKATVTITG